MNKLIKNQNGATLPLVLMTLVVLSIFTMTVISIASTNSKVSTVEADRVKAYYIARTGAESFADYIINKPEMIDDLKQAGIIGIESEVEEKKGEKSIPFNFGEGTVSVRITKLREKIGYKVTGIGKVGNNSEITSVVIVPKDIENLYRDRSLLSLDSTQKMQIGSVGKVGTNSFISGLVQTNFKSIQFDKIENEKDIEWQVNAKINNLKTPDFTVFKKNYLVSANYEHQINNFDKTIITASDSFTNIQLDGKDLEISTLTEDINIYVQGKIDISKATLKLNSTKGRTINIYAEDIQLQNKSKLEIEGAGNVNIISRNEIQIHNAIEGINMDIERNNLKFIAKNKIQIDGNSSLMFKNIQNIYFYSEKGDIQIQHDTDFTAEGEQNIYFHAKNIQLDKIKLTANKKSKVHFFVEGGNFQTAQNSDLLTDSLINKPLESKKDEEVSATSEIFVVVDKKGSVKIGQDSTFHGYVYALESHIQIDQGAKLRGSFIGKTIQTNSSIKLEHSFPSKNDMSHLEDIIPLTNSYEAIRREK